MPQRRNYPFYQIDLMCALALGLRPEQSPDTGKRPGKPFLPGSVVLGPVNSGLWAFSGEVRDERTGAGLA